MSPSAFSINVTIVSSKQSMTSPSALEASGKHIGTARYPSHMANKLKSTLQKTHSKSRYSKIQNNQTILPQPAGSTFQIVTAEGLGFSSF